jgi:heme-dependent oxidative N-demethylase alpha subunit-like protein
MTLADVFPEADYSFHLRFERGTFGDFFNPTVRRDELLGQRRHWLQSAPQTYAALLPDGIPLLDETLDLALAEQTLPADFRSPQSTIPSLHHSITPLLHQSTLLDLGRAWEPDFLLLKPDSTGQIVLVGGCVCFPSSWSLAEKIGRPIDAIHGVVPGLNAAIGNQIQGFLKKLRPGVAWLRANWGLSRSPELNQHPERALPRLDSTVRLDEIWLRIEHQLLTALSRTHGILFAIRIAMHPLPEIQADPLIAPRLTRALETMPEAMAEYKGMANARAKIISLLCDR